jgi:hypothetical protein
VLQEPATGPCLEPGGSHPVSFGHNLISSLLCLDLRSSFFPSGPQSKISHVFITSPLRAICPVHLILLHLITVINVSEEYKL